MGLSTLRIAWRNLGRNRKRTALALTAIVAGQLALLFTDGLMHGFADAMLETITGPMLGHVQIHARKWRKERAIDLAIEDLERTLADIREVPGVEHASPRILAPALAAVGEDANIAFVVGVDAATESRRTGMLAGIPPEKLPAEHRVLVGAALAKVLEVKIGAELAIVGQGADGSIANDLYTVVGVVPSLVDMVNRKGIIMSLADAQELFVMPDRAHEIAVHGKPPVVPRLLAEDLARRPSLAGAEVVPWEKIVPTLAMAVKMMDFTGLFVLFLVFVAAAAGIANTLMTSTFERLHEFGMLLALGCRPRRIVRMIFTEAIVLGLLGIAIGTALGVGAVLATSGGVDMMAMGGEAAPEMAFQGMTFPTLVYPRLAVMDIVIGVIAIVVTSLVAAIWPAMFASRLEPVEAMQA